MENINGVPTVAGWHDDPEDPNFIRYSNGRAWTGERVAKDRTLTLKNDNVYRPGGGIGSLPKEEPKEEPVVEEPVTYQPLTRRERRLLESPAESELEPMSDLFEDEFEFQSATPVARPYAPSNRVHDEPVPVVEEKPKEAEAEVSFFDGFEDAFPRAKKTEVTTTEESDEPEESSLPSISLPSLDMGDFVTAPARPKPAEKKVEVEDEPSSLPALGGFGSSNEIPSLDSFGDDGDEAEEDGDEDEFFSVSTADSGPNDEPATKEHSFIEVASETPERLSYEPPVVQRHSYEPPVAVAPVAAIEDEVSPKSDKKTSEPVTKAISDDSDGYEFGQKFIDYDAQDDVPESAPFGFKSKLIRPADNETADDKPVAAAAPAPQPKEKVEVDVPVTPDDDADSEDSDDQPTKFGGRFKSLFGRSNKEVLDYDYQNNDEEDDDESESSEAPAVSKPVVKSVKPNPVAEDDSVDEEEPTLKVGIFSSRQDKEDAAVEVELVDRLNDLARRVAALTKEEAETLTRLEAAKAREAELNAMILKAHEEHELLDQLAKGRRKEMDGQQVEKEDDKFMEFLESHDVPVKNDEPEETVALPVVAAKDEESEEENDSSEDRLPELKFN